MRYAQIRSMDTTNGEGIGVALFTQGCENRCKNCFNQDTWDLFGGEVWSKETENRFIEYASQPYITRVSILGGEPLLDSNYPDLFLLIDRIKRELPHLQIWLWTGYNLSIDDFKDKGKSPLRWRVLEECDYVIDGPFIYEERDLTLKFRGSRNQRIIDVKRTLKENEIIEYKRLL